MHSVLVRLRLNFSFRDLADGTNHRSFGLEVRRVDI